MYIGNGATVDDIEYDYGKPDETQDTKKGYIYTYYFDGKSSENGRIEEQYTDFLFNKDDQLTSIKSTNTVKTKRFSPGKTVFTVVFFTVILPVAIVLEIVAAAEPEY
jgi:hypothetical protein